ncbi:sporulation protein [Streptomyces eurocidicus]|uniref:Sporulation protein n=1 Tax=Streptomyces eurocidicus TaxID=66423 RepID=A0A2N8P3C7_STREU|nr:sporulation protein [Streptomyces eurocidicus]MBB5117722.1 tetratricopeptide (TPR) repeat protein [Streptomyces eurocidicus]MBF6053557.1 sporulation protein [Streptomyces eurocidicus]PNE35516.1 sporulation protein [Streptomyces eurocidicus]
MASTVRRTRPPNADLARLIEASGASHKALAHRINQLAQAAGIQSDYSHTSIANWCRRGMTPKWPVPRLLAQAVGERLGRPVPLTEIGMGEAETPDADLGLDFPREPADAVRVATSFWSSVNRRDFLTGSSFALSAFTTPVTRWLVTPADDTAHHRGGTQVGRLDLEELRDAADEARRWDSKYGGGNWRANSVTTCLEQQAVPLLQGSFSDKVGRELFSVTSELSRLAGWTAFDVGQHEVAQRHFIQALRLARAGGDVQLGCYVLTTMAMQALMRGFAEEAIDMAQGAFERAKHDAVPRVLAFTKLIEARAHARTGDGRAASQALATSESLLERTREDNGDEPGWIDFYHHARLSADATEVFRDLKNPKTALTWNQQAAAMQPGVFTRSVGMRLAIVGTAHLQARDLDHGLELGNRSVDILTRVKSTRALDYVREFNDALTPWRREPAVRDFLHRTRKGLGTASPPLAKTGAR